MYLTVDRVGVNVESIDFERIGMHKQRVALGVVDGDGAVGTHGIARLAIVLTIVAGQLVLVDGIQGVNCASRHPQSSTWTDIRDTACP